MNFSIQLTFFQFAALATAFMKLVLFLYSMNKIGEVYKKSTKQVGLERRKNLLAEMLCKETESFEVENLIFCQFSIFTLFI